MIHNSENNVILTFKGQIEFDNINDLIHALRDKMRERKVSFGVYKKVLMLMIESLENIIRYRENFSDNKFINENFPPEFQIYIKDNAYIIESSNPIQNRDIKYLSERLTSLNEMDKQALKALYKEKITDGKFSEKGGAGLGIIEMAKLTDDTIDFSFSPINNDFSFFVLRLLVRIN